MMAKARAWIAANPQAMQPWDDKKFKWPGGDSKSPANVQMWAVAPSMASAKSWGNYPAIGNIMSCVFEGGLVDFDTACRLESRYFANCVVSQVSKNMIGSLWRSEEHTSELQSLMRISYAVFCLEKKRQN